MNNVSTNKEYFIWYNADNQAVNIGEFEEFEQDKSKSIIADEYQLICKSGRQSWVLNLFDELITESSSII